MGQVGEKTKEDCSSLFGTVRSNKVLDLILIELTTAVVKFGLLTFDVVSKFKLFFLLLLLYVT